jgi:hypothetical protein
LPLCGEATGVKRAATTVSLMTASRVFDNNVSLRTTSGASYINFYISAHSKHIDNCHQPCKESDAQRHSHDEYAVLCKHASQEQPAPVLEAVTGGLKQ